MSSIKAEFGPSSAWKATTCCSSRSRSRAKCLCSACHRAIESDMRFPTEYAGRLTAAGTAAATAAATAGPPHRPATPVPGGVMRLFRPRHLPLARTCVLVHRTLALDPGHGLHPLDFVRHGFDVDCEHSVRAMLLQGCLLLLQKLVQFAQRLAARRRQARLFLGSLPMHLDRGDAVGHFVTCHSCAHTDSSLCFLLGVALKRCDGTQCLLAARGLHRARCGAVPLQNFAKGCTPRRADASLGAGSGAAPRTAAMRPTDRIIL